MAESRCILSERGVALWKAEIKYGRCQMAGCFWITAP